MARHTTLLTSMLILSAMTACGTRHQADSNGLNAAPGTHAAPAGNFQGAYAVWRDGRVIESGGQGLANNASGERNTLNTAFRAGSVTKPFTATAILMLAEQGKLTLEDPMKKHLPDWQNGALTLRHLLTHTSGIDDVERMASQFKGVRDSQDLYQRIKSLRIWGQPQVRFSYSSTNYLLLGVIVERVAGIGFDRYLDENVFRPLGMASSGIRFPMKGLPAGYAGGGGGQPAFPQESNEFPFSAGALYTSVNDLRKFDAALKRGVLITAANVTRMMGDQSGGYGFGFMTDGPRPYHPGRINGYSAMWISSRPGRDEGVIVLSNGGQKQVIARQFAQQLAQSHL